MLDAGEIDLTAVRTAFCIVVGGGRLAQGEVAGLLGLGDDGVPVGRVLPDVLDVRGETTVRLLVRADAGLARLMPDLEELVSWLRSEAAAYDGRSPLAAFRDLADLRAVVRVLEAGW